MAGKTNKPYGPHTLLKGLMQDLPPGDPTAILVREFLASDSGQRRRDILELLSKGKNIQERAAKTRAFTSDGSEGVQAALASMDAKDRAKLQASIESGGRATPPSPPRTSTGPSHSRLIELRKKMLTAKDRRRSDLLKPGMDKPTTDEIAKYLHENRTPMSGRDQELTSALRKKQNAAFDLEGTPDPVDAGRKAANMDLMSIVGNGDHPTLLQDFKDLRKEQAGIAKEARALNTKDLQYVPSPVKGSYTRMTYKDAKQFQLGLRKLIEKGYVDSKGFMGGAEIAENMAAPASQDAIKRYIDSEVAPFLKNFDFKRKSVGGTRRQATDMLRAIVDETSRVSPQLADEIAAKYPPLVQSYIASMEKFHYDNTMSYQENLKRYGKNETIVGGKTGSPFIKSRTGAEGVAPNRGDYKRPLAGAYQRHHSGEALALAREGQFTKSLIHNRLSYPKLPPADGKGLGPAVALEKQLENIDTIGMRYKPRDTHIDEARRSSFWNSETRGTEPDMHDIIKLVRDKQGDELGASNVRARILETDGAIPNMSETRGQEYGYGRGRPNPRQDLPEVTEQLIQEGRSQVEAKMAYRKGRALEKQMDAASLYKQGSNSRRLKPPSSRDWEALVLGSKKTMERAAPAERLLLDAIRRNSGKVPLETAEALGAGSSKILALLGRLAAKIPK